MKDHSFSFRAITCFLFLLGTEKFGHSAEVGLNFTGLVTASVSSPYGIPIPVGTVFSGHLVYESNASVYGTAPTNCSDCAAYLHRQINGLHVAFPGLTLQADEYIVQVRNDATVSGKLSDVITFWFPEQTLVPPNPDLGESLLINESAVSSGSFRIDLVAPSSTLPDSQLPDSLDPFVFMPLDGSGTFGDGMPNPNFFDMFFKPQSVSAFPHSTSDHDLDGDIDGRDFLIWQRNADTASGNGDADSNLLVDGTDLEMWQADYGSAVSDLKATIAVPEPNCLALLAGVSLIGLYCR